MLLARNRAITILFIAALAVAGPSLAGESAKQNRLPNQTYNRGLLIVTEAKPEVYVNMPDHYDVGSPSISPDGKWIAFDAMTIGEHPVRESWLVGVDGAGLGKLCDGATPRWSIQGRRLVVTRDPHGDAGEGPYLLEIERASGKQRKLCQGRFGDWSPDGKRLAFSNEGQVTYNGGTHSGSKLFIAKADGRDPEELCAGDWPSWSPDGRKLAFCRHEENTSPTLWVMDLEAKTRRRLGAGFYRPQWAGDGKSLVAKGLLLAGDANNVTTRPARFWLDGDRLDFFFMDRDNPWSPCLSRDGKTVVVVADSPGKKNPTSRPKKINDIGVRGTSGTRNSDSKRTGRGDVTGEHEKTKERVLCGIVVTNRRSVGDKPHGGAG